MVLGSKRVSRIAARRKASTEAQAEAVTRAVAYIRVSTDEQASHGHGLDTQDRAVRAFAESQRYELVEVVSDPGVSGATRPADRPGFARVVEMAEAGQVTVLLVYRFDRLARHIAYAVNSVVELGEHGVAIRSVTEPIDTATPMGRTIFAILAGMADQERTVITDRTASGRLSKARTGGFAGGRAPYGYERDGSKSLRIVPREARIVRRIYEARRKGQTLQAIADRLNAEGVPSPQGRRWHPPRVAYVVDNPKYRGAVEYLFTWNGAENHVLAEGQHEAIVT